MKKEVILKTLPCNECLSSQINAHGIGQESPMENKTGLEDISAAHAKLRADVVMCISQR